MVGIKKSIFKGEEDSFSFSYDVIDSLLTDYKKGGFFLFKLPAYSYWKTMVYSAKYLLESGFKGVYFSFQRPYNSMLSIFKQFGTDLRDIYILDLTNIKEDGYSPSSDVNELWVQVFSFLNKLNVDKKFVFIDSITTMSLINSEKWIDGFFKFLTEIRNEKKLEDVFFLFNVAKELVNKKIVLDISSLADVVLDMDSYISVSSPEPIPHNIFL